MSVLYCTIPHFAAALVRRDRPELGDGPLVLIGPQKQVFGASAKAAACGISAGMSAQTAKVRCPEARLLEANVTHCRSEMETLFQVLEQSSSRVEPHGWGAAYVDLGNRSAEHSRRSMAHNHDSVVMLLQTVGRTVRRELGEPLQPALGWDSNKFTAWAAACCTPAGHLRAVEAVKEQRFLRPLPVTLLPLTGDVVQRLGFLGLRTLGQYAALPRAAVWQQFGPAGILAQRCAQGQDDRPVIPRHQVPQMAARVEFEAPLGERGRLVAALEHLVSPLLAKLRGRLQACGQVRLTVWFDDGDTQEQERTFLFPTLEQGQIVRALEQLLAAMRWPAPACALSVALLQIQDAVAQQLPLFPLVDEGEEKLGTVQRYLAGRFGSRLRRAVMTQPGAPLPEWRVGWLDEGEP